MLGRLWREGKPPTVVLAVSTVHSQHAEQPGGFSSKKGMKLGHSREKKKPHID